MQTFQCFFLLLGMSVLFETPQIGDLNTQHCRMFSFSLLEYQMHHYPWKKSSILTQLNMGVCFEELDISCRLISLNYIRWFKEVDRLSLIQTQENTEEMCNPIGLLRNCSWSVSRIYYRFILNNLILVFYFVGCRTQLNRLKLLWFCQWNTLSV